MKIIYLSNFFNHHQKPLADKLYSILGDNYRFIETYDEMPSEQKRLGYQSFSEPYILKYSQLSKLIDKLIMDADVVIHGEAPVKLIKNRLREKKLVIRDDECRYRNYTRFLKWPIYTYNSYYYNKGYLLCASAYGPIDYFLSGMRPSRCFKWGYFTEIKKYASVDSLMANKHKDKKNNILWAGRLIGLKHPEYALHVAEYLREKKVDFKIDIIGDGKLLPKLQKHITKKRLSEFVRLLGAMRPDEVRAHMEAADIFLFTSDRNEGWGAVLNESMNSGCAVVADSNIGSVPYLVEDRVNGLIYNSKNKEELSEKVLWLCEHPNERRSIGKNAYMTMLETWNADNAANNVISLCENLLEGKSTKVELGPCSKAPLIFRTWRGRFKII